LRLADRRQLHELQIEEQQLLLLAGAGRHEGSEPDQACHLVSGRRDGFPGRAIRPRSLHFVPGPGETDDCKQRRQNHHFENWRPGTGAWLAVGGKRQSTRVNRGNVAALSIGFYRSRGLAGVSEAVWRGLPARRATLEPRLPVRVRTDSFDRTVLFRVGTARSIGITAFWRCYCKWLGTASQGCLDARRDRATDRRVPRDRHPDAE